MLAHQSAEPFEVTRCNSSIPMPTSILPQVMEARTRDKSAHTSRETWCQVSMQILALVSIEMIRDKCGSRSVQHGELRSRLHEGISIEALFHTTHTSLCKTGNEG